ncbi:MAG: GNAT family N-acetyltransferase, partial [Chloroflexales bacterium]|nr:GNAT family N-acetyltransferase [Chloroflexales bacterium]
MTSPSIDYGLARADELERLTVLLEQALGFGPGGMAPWLESIGHANVRAVRQGGAPVAGLAIIPMGHWFGGRTVPTGGITAVGVAPPQRGSGVGFGMLRATLHELHEQGTPLSSLYPATTAFYRRTGYERASTRVIYEQPLAAIGLRDHTLEAVAVDPSQHDTLKQLYAQQAAVSSSFIDRPAFYWDGFLKSKDQTPHIYLALRDGQPEGYVVFFQGRWTEPLNVRDIVALTPAAARRLLTLLADHRSVQETVRWPGGPVDSLQFLMAEQKQKVFRAIDLMLRIVDVAGALEARGYSPGVDAELHLEVADDVLAWNNGRFVLEVADGRGRVSPGGQGRLRLHARDLAALYSAYLSPYELRQAGSLTGDADLAAVALVFGG